MRLILAGIVAALLLAGPASAARHHGRVRTRRTFYHRHASTRHLHIPSLAVMKRRLAWVRHMNARYPVVDGRPVWRRIPVRFHHRRR